MFPEALTDAGVDPQARGETLGIADFARVAERLGGDGASHRELLAAGLLQCYLSNMVAFHVEPAQFELELGRLPRASTLAREQAARGWPIVPM